jgi:hypothetical protein
MVTHSGKPLGATAGPVAPETAVTHERERLRRELLQRILQRETRRQALRRVPR